MSVVEFSVDGESFQFPKPIEAGKTDYVQISRKKPTDCEKKKAGIVKLDCKGKTTVIDKLEVCVLS